MINNASIKKVNQSNLNEYFKKPLYESYCFANIDNLIKYSFEIEKNLIFPEDIFGNLPKKYKKIILFFIDGFGWRFIEKYLNHSFFKKIEKYSVLNKITSQFPSTTSAHVTKIHTSLTVGESGVFEWNYYEPKVDDVITPLLFSFANKQNRDSLKNIINPKDIYPKKTFYKHLKKQNINSYIFQHQEYTPSTYSNIVFEGASVYGYRTLPEAITNLFYFLEKENNQSYYFLYFDKIDSISHLYSPESNQAENEVISFLEIMDKIFLKYFFEKSKNTLFLLIADHGHMTIHPEKTFYINLKIPKIKKWLKTNKNDQFLVPAGSPRDMFLYVKEKYLFVAKNYLEKKLKNIGEVYLTSDLMKQGFFGKKISKNFKERVGNLIILPYKNESVWWYEKGVFEQKFKGHHGGLTKEEIEIPLLLLTK